jgi:hypothetical protein
LFQSVPHAGFKCQTNIYWLKTMECPCM